MQIHYFSSLYKKSKMEELVPSSTLGRYITGNFGTHKVTWTAKVMKLGII
jgi:hypothetical protein